MYEQRDIALKRKEAVVAVKAYDSRFIRPYRLLSQDGVGVSLVGWVGAMLVSILLWIAIFYALTLALA